MHRPCILVVDDDIATIKILRRALEANGFKMLAAINGAEALKIVGEESPDLLILDIMMPEMDGFEVCRRIREWLQIPIIMLSALSHEQEKVKCLMLGADDYVAKPFGVHELIARVNAVLRRTTAIDTIPAQPSFSSGNLQINFAERKVITNGSEVRLTPTEYNLLKELVLNAGKVLTYTQLLNKIWGPEYGQEREYLYVFIGRLRAKLEPDPQNARYIVTVPGVGYKFQAST